METGREAAARKDCGLRTGSPQDSAAQGGKACNLLRSCCGKRTAGEEGKTPELGRGTAADGSQIPSNCIRRVFYTLCQTHQHSLPFRGGGSEMQPLLADTAAEMQPLLADTASLPLCRPHCLCPMEPGSATLRPSLANRPMSRADRLGDGFQT